MDINIRSVEMLGNIMKGDVLTSSDKGYDEARKIWNGMFDKKPAVIARCTSVQDVVEAVKFANEQGLLVAVKGGGHNSAGTASCDGGIMIDLSKMNKVEVDPQARTVRAQGGSLLADVDAATSNYGLAVSAGVVSHTGVGGLALGGGFGWLSRKFGLSVDNMISAELVTAEGKVVRASRDVNPDLFWAIRGGGGNFGIVTEFEFRCAEIGTEVYSGVIIKKFEDSKAYMKFHREYVRTMPDEMTIWMILRHAPPLPFLPAEHHGKLAVVVAFVYVGDPDRGKALIQPVRDYGETLGDGSGMNPWPQWQKAFDPLVPHGARNYWKSHHLTGLPDDCIDVIREYAIKMPTGECEVFIPHMEGAASRIPSDATAYSFRGSPFVMNIHTRWQHPADDERCIKWARGLYEATRPFSKGVYVNFISDTEAVRAREAYTDEVWRRLKLAKQKWDPNNFFRLNMNIKPDGSE